MSDALIQAEAVAEILVLSADGIDQKTQEIGLSADFADDTDYEGILTTDGHRLL